MSNVGVLQAKGNPHRVIVTFEEGTILNENALANADAELVKELQLVNGAVVMLPNQLAVKKLKMTKGVKNVEPDVLVYALAPPGACNPWPECKDSDPDPEPDPEPSQTTDWGVDRIDADLTWSLSTGVGVKVAVIDTGIDKDHPDLSVAGGINFVSKNPRKPADPNKWDDDNGHGTHVAGIVGALDNDIGVVGVAPNADLYAVKVLDRNGSGWLGDVISGIEWAVANDMDVINMSLGTTADIQALNDAVDAAYNEGVVVVAASGNSGDGNDATNNVEYPAKYSSVIAVGATASNDSAPYWSSDGEEVELSAPGVAVLSTYKDGGYAIFQGTSMASPHVAGVVALMLQNTSLTPLEVRTALQANAEDLGPDGHDNHYGYGLVDAEAVLN
jgi:subtilisin family serine protease